MKTLIILFLSTFVVCAATESDLLTGLDPTTLTSIKASQLLQMINNGTIGATNKGGILRAAFTPDTINNPRYTNFVWIDTSAGLPGSIKSWNGTGWSSASFSAGSITATNLAPGAVTQAALATNAVDTINIVNSAVTSAKIGALQIINSLIGAGAVSNLNIADRTITGAKIATQTIENTNILDGTITSSKFAAGTISGASIGSYTITVDKMATNSIGRSNIIAGAVGNEAITNNAVQTNNISINGATAGQVLGVNGTASAASWLNQPLMNSASLNVGTMTGANLGFTNAHGLSGVPSVVRLVLTNNTTEFGYAVGDELDISHYDDGASVVSVSADASNVYVALTGGMAISSRLTGHGRNAITYARWGLKAYVFK